MSNHRYYATLLLVLPTLAGAVTSPVVDTGQDGCYDAAGSEITCPSPGESVYGQDAQHTGNQPWFTDNGNGTVTDQTTGLTWQQTTDSNGDRVIDSDDRLTYADALAYCDALSLGGQDDWRLPDIKQLYSLIDFRGTDPSGLSGPDTAGLTPFIDTGWFAFGYGDTDAGERIIDAQYASSTLYVGNTANDGGATMFGVNLADGRIKGYGLAPLGQQRTFYTQCVRDNPDYGVNQLIDNGDGTISDAATGLMWAQGDSGGALDWEEALAWVEVQNAASHLGHSDWRLPNAKELQGIVDYTRSPDTTGSAAIDPLFLTSTIVNEAGVTDWPTYWSSTTHLNGTLFPGATGVYVAFGRALGYMNGGWVDVHGAGAQRSDPKVGDPADYPYGRGPQGDAIRIYNHARLVRDVTEGGGVGSEDPGCPSGTTITIDGHTYKDGTALLCRGKVGITAGPAVMVEAGASVTYSASGSVTLLPGFVARSESLFQALIEAP